MESSAPIIIHASSELYRTAICLNNLSASLLQQSRYHDGLKIMTDSLAILKLVFSGANTTQSWELAKERYKAALTRCHAERIPDIAYKTSVTAIDDDDYISLHAAGHSNKSRRFFPIRIRDIPPDGSSSTEATRQFGILLYNHGVAQFLHSSQASSRSKREQLLNGALKSLQMSQQTYSRILFDDLNQDSKDEHDVHSLLLFTLTLNCSSHVFLAQNSVQKVIEVQEAVSTLRQHMVEDSDQAASLLRRDTAPAA